MVATPVLLGFLALVPAVAFLGHSARGIIVTTYRSRTLSSSRERKGSDDPIEQWSCVTRLFART